LLRSSAVGWLVKGKGHVKDYVSNGVGDYGTVPTGVPGPISLTGIARWKEKKFTGNVPIFENFPLFSGNEGEKQHPPPTYKFPQIQIL